MLNLQKYPTKNTSPLFQIHLKETKSQQLSTNLNNGPYSGDTILNSPCFGFGPGFPLLTTLPIVFSNFSMKSSSPMGLPVLDNFLNILNSRSLSSPERNSPQSFISSFRKFSASILSFSPRTCARALDHL